MSINNENKKIVNYLIFVNKKNKEQNIRYLSLFVTFILLVVIVSLLFSCSKDTYDYDDFDVNNYPQKVESYNNESANIMEDDSLDIFTRKTESWISARKANFYQKCFELKKPINYFYELDSEFGLNSQEFNKANRLLISQLFINLIFFVLFLITSIYSIVEKDIDKNIYMSCVNINKMKKIDLTIKFLFLIILYIIVSIVFLLISINGTDIKVLQYNNANTYVCSIYLFYVLKQLCMIPVFYFLSNFSFRIGEVLSKKFIVILIIFTIILAEFLILLYFTFPTITVSDVYVKYMPFLNVLYTDEIIGNRALIISEFLYILLGSALYFKKESTNVN